MKKEKNDMEGKTVIFVACEDEGENADGVRGHLEITGTRVLSESKYERYGKRFCDVTLSFLGMVLLAPVFLGITVAIWVDDPGPVLFSQKRIGKNKAYFRLHKFRSMKLSTPHDIPTHQMNHPEKYITKVGSFLRAHSLDELPQIWDIFVGNMSIVGPRPALWNQDFLVAERDKYNANDVMPGLTGWAQLHGRDMISIEEKAKLDGEYVKKLGFRTDLRCLLDSVKVFWGDKSISEGKKK